MAQVVEGLSCKFKALSSSLCTTPPKKKKKKKKKTIEKDFSFEKLLTAFYIDRSPY
jgi:hypothetical protein